MIYSQRWALALALRQPFPRADTGDIMTTEPASSSPATTTSSPTWSMSPADIKTAIQNMSKAAWMAVGIGAVLGAALGFALGRKSSK